ncbi:thioredoxin TrxC [Vibrio salinus]|uniref:thioredoxin TrxC n=1 Tax=Vibrio salinus TaxID=2899784 RepID=UPI001E31D7AA|nr:thioredoxin TrxC [Vibrio salinus]MCE0496036.1 thioredoxin TrxC [Vibrio salinus]
MSAITTRCPHCKSLNRIPVNRLNEAPNCGKCQSKLLDGKPVEGTEENLSVLINSDIPVVIDFWATWCNPCVGFAPVFEDVSSDFTGKARFIKVDTEAQQQLATQFQIRSIPTIMVFHKGNRLDVINGALPKSQFTRWLNDALNKN